MRKTGLRAPRKIPYFQDPGSIDSARADVGVECAYFPPAQPERVAAEHAINRLPLWIGINLLLLLSCGVAVVYFTGMAGG